jgi:hypothetical protein
MNPPSDRRGRRLPWHSFPISPRRNLARCCLASFDPADSDQPSKKADEREPVDDDRVSSGEASFPESDRLDLAEPVLLDLRASFYLRAKVTYLSSAILGENE